MKGHVRETFYGTDRRMRFISIDYSNSPVKAWRSNPRFYTIYSLPLHANEHTAYAKGFCEYAGVELDDAMKALERLGINTSRIAEQLK